MKQYTDFASVYDTFMDNIPYSEWCSYLAELLWDNQIEGGAIVELGCGTGNAAMNMIQHGYRVYGIDNSKSMLNIALQKRSKEFRHILHYSLQDMRSFSLPHSVKAMYSICDSMNYLTKRDDFIKALRCVRENLSSNGIFVFDLKTLYFYENILGDSTFADVREKCSYIWENHFNHRTHMNWYRLNIFTKKDSRYYRRFKEIHQQRAYTQEEIRDIIQASGLKLVHVYDAFSFDEPKPDSERLYYIVRKED